MAMHSTSGNSLKGYELFICVMCTLMFTVSRLTLAKIWNQSPCPSTEQVRKSDIYKHDEIILRHKKKDILCFVTK